MKTCVFPGTFDPFTKGHLDLVTRAKKMFDKVIVAVSDDRAKCAFSQEERFAKASVFTACFVACEMRLIWNMSAR